MKFHYKHQQGDPRCTIAIEDISKDVLESLIKLSNDEVNLKVGVTFVHPKDQYVKKLGREAAESVAHDNLCYLSEIKIISKRTIFRFHTYVPDARPGMGMQVGLNFGLALKPESPYVFLDYAYVD